MKLLSGVLFNLLILSVHIVSAQEDLIIAAATDPELSINTSIKPLIATPAVHKAELAVIEFGREYFPFNTDKIYHFDSNLGDTEATFESTEGGVTLTFDAPNMEYRQTLTKDLNGVFLKRTEMSAFLFFGNDIKYVEPVLRIPFPLKEGDIWEWHALETEDEDTTKLVIHGEVLGRETVATPYGEFNCVKIRQHVKSENGSDNILTEWFAPNMGLVKSHAVLEGSGLTGFIQSVFGYDEVTFELAAVVNRDDN